MLVIMVKNESKIIRRCLDAALAISDAILVADTGSTDNTVELARAYSAILPTKVVQHAWRNFGHNRTLAFLAAQAFATQDLKWSPTEMTDNFALLLDADMVLQIGNGGVHSIRQYIQAETVKARTAQPPRPAPRGFGIHQLQGTLDYVNTRLLRMVLPWRCMGVTHEYWETHTDKVMARAESARKAEARATQAALAPKPTGSTHARLQQKLKLKSLTNTNAGGGGDGAGVTTGAGTGSGAGTATTTGQFEQEDAAAAGKRMLACMGEIVNMPKTYAWIKDVSDGGCKDHKFPRDLALLTQGLIDEPKNVRYMFYLAQTHKDMGNPLLAIPMYKKRIAAGGWNEEVWYSHYMVARQYADLALQALQKSKASGLTHAELEEAKASTQLYLRKAESWVQKGYALRPSRAEALTMLVEVMQTMGNVHKAWHYLQIAKSIPLSEDVLFVAPGAYGDALRAMECTLVYAITNDANQAMDMALAYDGAQGSAVRSASKAYIQQLGTRLTPIPRDALPDTDALSGEGGVQYIRVEDMDWTRLQLPEDILPPSFVSSSVCALSDGTLNIRAVNYRITEHGSYTWPAEAGICTRNYKAQWDPCARAVVPGSVSEVNLPPSTTLVANPQATIHGLEDMRIFGTTFTATTPEFSEQPNLNRMIIGSDYPTLATARVVQPPSYTACEKNWIPLDTRGERFVYSWLPLRIGELRAGDDHLHIVYESRDVPAWFKHARGSSPPMLYKGAWWFMVHSVYDATPRVYAHAWVVMNPATYEVVAYTRPFYLRHQGIEYVLGAQVWDDHVHIFTSVWDRESWVGVVHMRECEALLLPSPSAVRNMPVLQSE
jgi:tetratricopeptide (TPR) repeat protein